MGALRWLVAVALLFLPIFILQYTFWGLVLHGPYLPVMLVSVISVLVAWLFTQREDQFLDWTSVMVSLVLLAGGHFHPCASCARDKLSLLIGLVGGQPAMGLLDHVWTRPV